MIRQTKAQMQSEIERLRAHCAYLEAGIAAPKQQQLPLKSQAYIAARDKVQAWFAQHPTAKSVTKEQLAAFTP